MRKYTLAFFSFFILFILMTYPLFFNFARFMPASFSTDESYAIIWNAWVNKLSFTNNLSLNHSNLIAYPFGVDLTGSGFLWFLINYILSILTTPVLTYNLQIVTNFLLNSFLTFFLSYYLTRSRIAAFFSGLAFGFCPYIFARSWQHLGETYLWTLPLILFALFKTIEKKSKSFTIFGVISIILTTINFNSVQYILVILPFFLLYVLFFLKFPLSSQFSFECKKVVVKRILFIYILSLLIVLPQFIPIIKNIINAKNSVPSAWNTYRRPFEDLFEQSARPLSYFLPSVAHPIFGKFTEQFVGTKVYGMSVTEHTLYLGWTVFILAFVAFRRWKKHIKSPVAGLRSPVIEENNYIGFFVMLAIVAWLWSQPPWWNIFSLKIYMPSFLMYKIIPIFRAYCRFGVVVMFAVSILAGFGLKHILKRFKSSNIKLLIAFMFCVLVLFEFWNWPPYKVIDVTNFPTVYSWLRDQPSNIVIAEYPLDAGSPDEMYKLYQVKHGKRMINGAIPGTPAHEFAQKIVTLSEPKTVETLRGIGVNYVLVHHKGYEKTGLVQDIDELNEISNNPDLKFLLSFPSEKCLNKNIVCIKEESQIDIYEVIAKPMKAK